MKIDSKNNLIHAWSILCQSSSVDANNNSLSLFNVIDDITIDINPPADGKLPDVFGVPVNSNLVTLWKRRMVGDEIVADVDVRLLDPTGKELQKMVYNMKIPADKSQARSIMNIQGFPVTVAGVYVFKISVKESGGASFQEVQEVPLNIIVKKQNIINQPK